jgi:hypothetical protein
MQLIGPGARLMTNRFCKRELLESANAEATAIVVSFMFSPSLFTKQQMELLFDHSTKSPTEFLREAAASANGHRPASKLGPLSGPEIPRFPGSDFKKRGGFTPDDDRLNAAVSRAGFGPAVSVGCTSALERVTDSSQTPLEVRKVPNSDMVFGAVDAPNEWCCG